MGIREQVEDDLKEIYNKYLQQMQSDRMNVALRTDIIEYFKNTYDYQIELNIKYINNQLNIDLLNTEDFFNTFRRRKIEKIKRNIWSKRFER